MKITISSGGHDDPRHVTVEDESGKLASFKADSLNEAHKALKIGRTEGWEAVTSDTLAAQTKAAAQTETKRVEAGKAKAEPKKVR